MVEDMEMSKKMFASLIIVGMLSDVFAVLAPLHEIWHVLASLFYGYLPQMHWGWTELASQNHTLPVCFAGIYGEALTLTVLFIVFFQKKHYMIATYLLGYLLPMSLIIIFSPTGLFMIDIEKALEIASAGTVQMIYDVWKVYYFILLSIPIGIIIHNSRVFFIRKGGNVSKNVKTSKKILTYN